MLWKHFTRTLTFIICIFCNVLVFVLERLNIENKVSETADALFCSLNNIVSVGQSECVDIVVSVSANLVPILSAITWRVWLCVRSFCLEVLRFG